MKPTNAQTVLRWLKERIFVVTDDGRVLKNRMELKQRINKRRGSNRGDPRVDLCNEGKRISFSVSRLLWMSRTRTTVPIDFEIHHLDENPTNNSWTNIVAVHKTDHLKFHYKG